jgi:hypothetical protein
MSSAFSLNPPPGSTPEQATDYVTGVIRFLFDQANLSPDKIIKISHSNLTSDSIQQLAIHQVARRPRLVADYLAVYMILRNPYVSYADPAFLANPVLTMLLGSLDGKEALNRAFHAAGHSDRRNLAGSPIN